jgi:hypothetical protein
MGEDQQDLEYDYRKQRYAAYLKDRDGLRSDSLEVSGRYDKAVLALGGGALALSVTFLEKIAPHPAPWTFVLLCFAWLFLIAAVLFELFALSSSQTVTNEQLEILNGEYSQYLLSLAEQTSVPEPTRRAESQNVIESWKERTRRLNRSSLIFLTIGIVLLCAFSVCNLPYRDGLDSNMSHTNKTAPGRPQPPARPLNESRGSYIAPSNSLPPPPPPKPTAPPPSASAPPPKK